MCASRLHRHFDLLPLLNPMTPLSRLFDGEAPEKRRVGIFSLVQIAAKVWAHRPDCAGT